MLLLVPHLFPGGRLREAVQALRLPALETLVARGERVTCADDGVEAALCEALGIARQQDWPVAPLTLLADGGAPEAFYWLRADPVHLRLLRDRIVLAGSGALHVSRDDASALAATVQAHFGAEFQPDPVHPQRWYLKYARPPELTTTSPSVAAGRNIEPLQPQGAGSRHMRALLNEVQMLFHAHPVNAAREARGEPAVTSLWVWGGGTLPPAPAVRRSVFADTADARAIGTFCGGTSALPAGLDELPDAAVVVLDALTPHAESGDALGWRGAAIELERDWFAPLKVKTARWGGEGLNIVDPVSGRGVHLRRLDMVRRWRVPRALSAVEWPGPR